MNKRQKKKVMKKCEKAFNRIYENIKIYSGIDINNIKIPEQKTAYEYAIESK